MALILLADLKHFFFGSLLFILALFLVLLVLVQRGRGGGLTGALGGMGGQSAFGSKAGDVFTRITIGVAAVWLILCVGAVAFLGKPSEKFAGPGGSSRTNTKSRSTGAGEAGEGASEAKDSGGSSERVSPEPTDSNAAPATDSPATDTPAEGTPAGSKPAENKPAENKPAESTEPGPAAPESGSKPEDSPKP